MTPELEEIALEAIEISFCTQCSGCIRSKKLADYWRDLCLKSITKSTWLRVREDEIRTLEYLKILEKKGFVVTLDHGDKIQTKPLGIQPEDGNHYLVCLSPIRHFN